VGGGTVGACYLFSCLMLAFRCSAVGRDGGTLLLGVLSPLHATWRTPSWRMTGSVKRYAASSPSTHFLPCAHRAALCAFSRWCAVERAALLVPPALTLASLSALGTLCLTSSLSLRVLPHWHSGILFACAAEGLLLL